MKRAVLVIVIAALSTPTIARAQNESNAARFFREGTQAFDAHEYRRAAQSFEDADHAKHAGAALLSAAIAWEFAGDFARAADDYEAALGAHDLDEKQSAQAHTRFDAVDAKLAHVEVRGSSDQLVAVGSGGFFPLPTHFRFAPGDHSLVVRFSDGRVEHRDIHVDTGSTVIDVTPPVQAPAIQKNELAPKPQSETGSSSSSQKILGWVGIGVGSAAIVTGIVVGGVGLSARNSFEDGGNVDGSLHDRAVSFRTAADVLLVSGVVVAGAGAILVLTAPKNSSVSVGLGSVRFSIVF
jgi:hypothetical protein